MVCFGWRCSCNAHPNYLKTDDTILGSLLQSFPVAVPVPFAELASIEEARNTINGANSFFHVTCVYILKPEVTGAFQIL